MHNYRKDYLRLLEESVKLQADNKVLCENLTNREFQIISLCGLVGVDAEEHLESTVKDLKAENENLQCDVKLWQKRTDEAAKIVETFEEIQAENEKLKKAAKKIMIGFDAPKFNPTELALGKNVKFSLSDPETAYYWGWEAAILECGEILSK